MNLSAILLYCLIRFKLDGRKNVFAAQMDGNGNAEGKSNVLDPREDGRHREDTRSEEDAAAKKLKKGSVFQVLAACAQPLISSTKYVL